MGQGPVVSGFQPVPGEPNTAHPRTVPVFLGSRGGIDPPPVEPTRPDPEPPAVLVPRWVFVAATVGRLWLAPGHRDAADRHPARSPAAGLVGARGHVRKHGAQDQRWGRGSVPGPWGLSAWPGHRLRLPHEGVVTHRIESVDGSGYATRGDANQSRDSEVTAPEDVLGLGRVLVKFAGLPWVWYHSQPWLYLALFIVSLVFGSWAVARDGPDAGDPRQGAVRAGPLRGRCAGRAAADRRLIACEAMTVTSVAALREEGGRPPANSRHPDACH